MKQKSIQIIKIVFSLFMLQLCLYALKSSFLMFVERTNFSDNMASMISMILLICIVITIARIFDLKMSVFPRKFSSKYIACSAIFLIVLILNPSNFFGNINAILLLIYSSIVTPMYEELVFRGIVWNQLAKLWAIEIIVYVINALLFGFWHLGYIGTVAFRISDGLMTIMIWKVITGLLFGLVLGFVRLKTKNCYSTMLIHGLLNIFGR